MSARVVIVVLNWNGRQDTLACLRSLRAVAYGDKQIVVVDNGSTDGSAAAIRAEFPDVELIETGLNLGYAGGNNVGIERALSLGADYVLVLNNDTTCAPDLIDRLVDAARRFPSAGMFCPRIFYMHDPTRVWFDGARWNAGDLNFGFPGKDRTESELTSEEHETDYACGAALFVRSDVIRQVGAFDARFFLVWEETDWCYRARAKGWSSMIVPSAKIWHAVGASFGTEASPLRTYFSVRNRLVWLFRHGTWRERFRAAREAAAAVWPRWAGSTNRTVTPWKRFAWAVRDWLFSAAGKGGRLDYLAKRRAILDFARGRLGPTPVFIIDLNQRWQSRRMEQRSAPEVA